MTVIDPDADVPGEEMDPDAELENDPEAEAAAYEHGGRDEPELSDDGHPGEVEPSNPLDGTGLELPARRVLSMRGVEVAALRAGGLESVPAPVPGGQLRDIVEASVPPARGSTAASRRLSASPAFESVIGPDERVRVFDTHLYPYSAIAALEITARDGTLYMGTAWFVSQHTLITAGHCVFVRDPQRPSANGWVRSIRVIPGRNGHGPGSEPFGSVTATRFRSVAGWVQNGSAASDYGAILLPPGATPNGGRVGQLGTAVYGDARLAAMNLNVAGYPADKKDNEAQTLWYDVKKTAQVQPRQLFYNADTYGGQSGAPVFEVVGGTRRVVAIHAYGTSSGAESNSGTRITAEVFNRIQAWKSQ